MKKIPKLPNEVVAKFNSLEQEVYEMLAGEEKRQENVKESRR